MYLTDGQAMRTEGYKWVCGFIALASASLIGYFMLSYGFATAGERLTRRLRERAFEAVSN